jgi:hypothetical protein
MTARVVHKHDLSPAFIGPHAFPGHTVALVGAQNREPFVWLERREDATQTWLQVIGTGHPVPVDGLHIASFQHDQFVWHVYQVGPR